MGGCERLPSACLFGRTSVTVATIFCRRYSPLFTPLSLPAQTQSSTTKLIIWLRPIAFGACLILLWQILAARQPVRLLPGPLQVLKAFRELFQHQLLLKYVVASLFRVTWGFFSATILAIPLGLSIGWYGRAEMAFNPLLQIFRPISPLAWIPLAILWFGVGDLSAVFIIFISCFLPLLLTAIGAVQSTPDVFIDAGRNFGLSPAAFL